MEHLKILKKIKDRIRWHYLIIRDSVLSKFIKFPQVLSIEESIDKASRNRMSICRFGDGELSLMCGNSLNFQKYDSVLAKKMEDAIRSENHNLLVCIPDCFSVDSLNSLCEIDRSFWRVHLMSFRQQWAKRLKPNLCYGNTWLSRIYSMKWDACEAQHIYSKLETLWNRRDVIMIEGAYSRLGIGNNCFAGARSIKRILAPAKNSYSRYQEILAAALSIEGDVLFILAMGPTATAMASELADAGRQAIDLGHIDIEYAWMQAGVKTKAPVRGKFCNEAFLTGQSTKEVTGELTTKELEEYKSQIIFDFS